MKYVGRSKKSQLITQLIGGLLAFFVVFIRYTSYGFITSMKDVDQGLWPIWLNAIFNSLASYLFILSFVLVFIPIFMGKLSIIRDIFASSFFRPLARISYSALMIQSLMLFFIFFTHEQSIYYDHKNMIFIYFSLVFFTYVTAVVVALFCEYPFRTMAKVVFSPPKKTLRLNKDLARELNTNAYRNDYMESEMNEESMMSDVNNNSMQKQPDNRDMFDDIDDVDMMVDDDDNIMDDDGHRVPSKKLGNLDLTLNVKENKISEEKDVSFAKNINNSTFSMLMSATASHKRGNQSKKTTNNYLFASDVSDREQLIYKNKEE